VVAVKVGEQGPLTEKRNDVWCSTDNLSLVLDKNTKTGDQSNSIETKYLKSEINIGDTQLNTSCSTEQSNSCYHLDSYAMTESLNPLCSPIITPSEDREGRTFHGCDYNGRTLAIVGSAGASTTIALAPERPQGQDGRAEVEEQEWEVIKILDKRETRSGTEYKVRWKSTWLPKSELGSARRLLWEYEAKSRAQHGPKRGRPSHKDKAWWSLYTPRWRGVYFAINFPSSNPVFSSYQACFCWLITNSLSYTSSK